VLAGLPAVHTKATSRSQIIDAKPYVHTNIKWRLATHEARKEFSQRRTAATTATAQQHLQLQLHQQKPRTKCKGVWNLRSSASTDAFLSSKYCASSVQFQMAALCSAVQPCQQSGRTYQ
jgi:pyridoxal/pyridoxine/pyridoxamine kinase